MTLSGIAGQWFAAVGLLLASLVCTPAAATTVSAGYSHSCAVSSIKDPHCWGTLASPQWLTGREYIDVQSGRDFSCALHNNGTVSCWGNNDHLQLGIPAGATPGPEVSGLPPAVQVAAGERHACARTHNGDVYCWGDARRGQLGPSGGNTASSMAIKVPGLSGAVQVAAAQASTCAVLQGGAVACVGEGSLLAGADSAPGTPRTVPGMGDAVYLALAEGHGCLVRRGGQVACWGHNASGELGTAASPAIAAVPVEVPGLGGPAQAVATGAGFSCALLQSGHLACWGKNTSGQLGTGYPLNATQAPTPVVGILKALSLSAGAEHACAVLEGGYVNCWGNAANNRLAIASCDLSSAYYPGFTYVRGPSFNNAACGSGGPAATPHAVDKLGPNRDIELVMRWAGRTLPDVFPGDYFSELFDTIPNFWISNYRNGRFLAVNMHGTPKLIFLGPESGNAMVDLGPLIDWVRPINPITPYIGQWVLTTNQPYYPPCTIDVRHAADDSSAGKISGTCYVSNGEERLDLSGAIDSRGVVTAASRPVNAPFSIYGLLNGDGSGGGVWKSGWIGTQWTASKH